MVPAHRVINLHLLALVLLHQTSSSLELAHLSLLSFPAVIPSPRMVVALPILSRGNGVHLR